MHLYSILQPVVKRLIIPVYRPSVSGTAHIPAAGGVVMACNHQAAAETYFVPCMIEREVHWLGKDSLFKGKGPAGRLFAWLMSSVNVIPVDRSGTGRGQDALAAGTKLLNSGKLLGIFPEGTRSPDGRLYRGKTGAVRLALATGAPIVPVAVLGAFESRKERSVLPRRSPAIHMIIGAPLDMRHELEALRCLDGELKSATTADAVVSNDSTTSERQSGESSDEHGTRYAADGPQLRALTQILMRAIQDMSGQEYVDEYAVDVKRKMKEKALAEKAIQER